MVPYKAGKANEGHSCVKGRFAYGYATHKDRILKPMIRERIEDPWREVSWDEAIAHAASEFKRIQAKYGRDSVGAITSSRCTNEEVFLVQKLVRAGFGNNNVDTCARVCHSPTGFGLSKTYRHVRRHAGFQVGREGRRRARDRRQSDRRPSGLRLAPEEAPARRRAPHRHRSAPHRSRQKPAYQGRPSSRAEARNQRRRPQCDRACRRHRGPRRRGVRARALRSGQFRDPGRGSSPSRDIRRRRPRRPPASIRGELRAAARLYATGGNGAIYYGLGVTEHSQGSTAVMAIANLAMATGNIGREGVGVNPLRGQNNVQGSCDMGSFPHEFSGYRHVSDDATREMFERMWGVPLSKEPGLRIPNMIDEAVDGSFKWPLRPGRGHRPVRPRHASTSPRACARWNASSCRISSSTRRRATPMSSCPARRSWRRTAPSPTPSAASAACARRSRRSPAWPTGRRRWRSPTRSARRCTTTIRARSWTRSPRRRRPSRACPMPGSTNSARSSGRATTRRRRARRSCMSIVSCAARASSC